MYNKIALPNGLRIVHEHMPDRRSSSLGIWIGVGSRNEPASMNGAAHFIEHMLFKGTKSRTAAELAAEMDGVGGQINAFTTREKTCFYARVLDSHLHLAIDLLTDMFFSSLFSETDVSAERGVILEEIGMYEDTPDDLVVERVVAKSLSGALSRPVLGKASTLKKMTGTSLRAFMSDCYTPERIVVSLCGNFEDSHIEKLSELFSHMSPAQSVSHDKSKYSPTVMVRRKATEQNHFCFAFPGLKIGADERFSMQLLSLVFGGGMSSRLFQTVREQHGLCYSIGDFSASYKDTGVYGVVTALGKDSESRALRLIYDELLRLRDHGLSAGELYRAREQAKSSLVLSQESTSARMQKLGASELSLGYTLSTDEVLERYDAVTLEQVSSLARRLIDFSHISFSAVGRVGTAEEYKKLIPCS